MNDIEIQLSQQKRHESKKRVRITRWATISMVLIIICVVVIYLRAPVVAESNQKLEAIRHDLNNARREKNDAVQEILDNPKQLNDMLLFSQFSDGVYYVSNPSIEPDAFFTIISHKYTNYEHTDTFITKYYVLTLQDSHNAHRTAILRVNPGKTLPENSGFYVYATSGYDENENAIDRSIPGLKTLGEICEIVAPDRISKKLVYLTTNDSEYSQYVNEYLDDFLDDSYDEAINVENQKYQAAKKEHNDIQRLSNIMIFLIVFLVISAFWSVYKSFKKNN